MKYKIQRKDPKITIKAVLKGNEIVDHNEFSAIPFEHVNGLFEVTNPKSNILEYHGPISVSLSERVQKQMNRIDFYLIINQLLQVMREVNRSSILMSSHVVLDEQLIFYNEATKELKLLYMPINEFHSVNSIQKIIENFVYSCKMDFNEKNVYISQFMSFYKSLPSFDLDKIQLFVYSQAKDLISLDPELDKKEVKSKKEIIKKRMDKDAFYVFGNSDVSDSDLSKNNQNDMNQTVKIKTQFVLIREANKEKIILNKNEFKLGKLDKVNDYCIDNPVVSKEHAKIIRKGDSFYIVDLASLNRVRINGKKIPPNYEVKLSLGDEITLANEKFKFKKL